MAASSRVRTGRVRGVVFDLDGTLVDGYEGIASGVNAARASFGLPALAEADVRVRVGLGLSHLMEDVVGPTRAVEATAIFRTVYDRVCVEQTRPVPALDVTLGALRARGFRMSVASNKPASYSIRILERLGVRPLFDTIEGPETAGTLKPDPAMILACLLAMNVSPEEALYVGDMTIDAEAGARAGVSVVLVSGGSSSKEVLRDTGHPVLQSLSDLLDFLPPRAALERGSTMNTTSSRCARARDFALIATGAAFFVLAALFVGGGIWFRALFVTALGGEPLLYAGGFLAAAVVMGFLHAFARPPLP